MVASFLTAVQRQKAPKNEVSETIYPEQRENLDLWDVSSLEQTQDRFETRFNQDDTYEIELSLQDQNLLQRTILTDQLNQFQELNFQASEIETQTFQASEIEAQTFQASEIETHTFQASEIETYTFQAYDIETYSFSASDIEKYSFWAPDIEKYSFWAPEIEIYVDFTWQEILMERIRERQIMSEVEVRRVPFLIDYTGSMREFNSWRDPFKKLLRLFKEILIQKGREQLIEPFSLVIFDDQKIDQKGQLLKQLKFQQLDDDRISRLFKKKLQQKFYQIADEYIEMSDVEYCKYAQQKRIDEYYWLHQYRAPEYTFRFNLLRKLKSQSVTISNQNLLSLTNLNYFQSIYNF